MRTKTNRATAVNGTLRWTLQRAFCLTNLAQSYRQITSHTFVRKWRRVHCSLSVYRRQNPVSLHSSISLAALPTTREAVIIIVIVIPPRRAPAPV